MEQTEQTKSVEPAEREETQKRKKIWPVVVAVCVAAVVAVAVYLLKNGAPKGIYDYTVQKEQYYVEYSEQYDYWDVLTIEYPVLEETEGSRGRMENLEQINTAFYDAAMDRVDYWHL